MWYSLESFGQYVKTLKHIHSNRTFPSVANTQLTTVLNSCNSILKKVNDKNLQKYLFHGAQNFAQANSGFSKLWDDLTPQQINLGDDAVPYVEFYSDIAINRAISVIDSLRVWCEYAIKETKEDVDFNNAMNKKNNGMVAEGEAIKLLSEIWEEIFELKATASVNPYNGNKVQGKFIEFAMKCLEHLGIQKTPEAIREYMPLRRKKKSKGKSDNKKK